MQFTDNTTLANTRLTADGYLVAEVSVARTGIQRYHSSEIGKGDGLVNVYRVSIHQCNWHFDMLTITQNALQNGKREISMGYTAELEWVDGVTPDGQAYQAKQKNIRINHLAIVDGGRAGATCRIGDALWGDTSPNNNTGEKPVATRTVMVDGLPIETTDNGATAIEKLQSDLVAQKQLTRDAQLAADTVIADKDTQLAAKDAEIDALKAKQLTDAEIDAKVAARSELIATAKAIHDADYTGKSDINIKTCSDILG